MVLLSKRLVSSSNFHRSDIMETDNENRNDRFYSKMRGYSYMMYKYLNYMDNCPQKKYINIAGFCFA